MEHRLSGEVLKNVECVQWSGSQEFPRRLAVATHTRMQADLLMCVEWRVCYTLLVSLRKLSGTENTRIYTDIFQFQQDSKYLNVKSM